MENKKVNILLVDDNPHFRKAIKEFLEKNSDFKVIGEANNGREMLEFICNESPDITIMDVFMPVMDGVEASKKTHEQFPNKKIIALTTHVGPVYTQLLKENGLRGCVLKENVHKEIVQAINTAMNNGYFYDGMPSNIPPIID